MNNEAKKLFIENYFIAAIARPGVMKWTGFFNAVKATSKA